MSMKSRRKVGFLISPFIALLTIGLPKPVPDHLETAGPKTGQNNSNQTVKTKEDENTPAVANDLNQKIAAAAQNILSTLETPKRARQTPKDAFQLSARLAVTAQLNRPKKIPNRLKKARPAKAVTPHILRTFKSPAAPAVVKPPSAIIIEFPSINPETFTLPWENAA